jgi:hypothetical protein
MEWVYKEESYRTLGACQASVEGPGDVLLVTNLLEQGFAELAVLVGGEFHRPLRPLQGRGLLVAFVERHSVGHFDTPVLIRPPLAG